MAERIIVYWRDIPAQIIVRAGRKTARRQLPKRFVEAIDRCAMKTGARDTDAYLAQWRRGAPEDVGDDLESAAEAGYAMLEGAFGNDRLKALIENDGWEPDQHG